ncbi:MAG: sugar phosphate isomerase/epimerase [Lentisphaeria bacterium]|nr:sugar phosphate isomerase/epimerase [Lentisphaeria bacterium]
MLTVISALHFAWSSMDECLGRAREGLGLDGVELSWHASFSRPHCTAGDLDDLRAVRSAHGLRLSAHIWENPAQLGPEATGEALRRWLEHAAATGVETLVMHGGSWYDRNEGLDRTREALEGILPDLAATGVVLCVENHYPYEYRGMGELFSEPWEFQRILGEDFPGIAFCLDTGHAHMARNGTLLIRELRAFLRYVHIADNHGAHDDHCPYRQGTVPWDEILPALREIGFDGTFCIEFPVREDIAPLRACLDDLRRRFA